MLELGDGRHGSTKRFRVRNAMPRSNLQQLLHLTEIHSTGHCHDSVLKGDKYRSWRPNHAAQKTDRKEAYGAV